MKRVVLTMVVLSVCMTTAALPRIPQDPEYHRMADQRTFVGVPNAMDVLSNLPFALAGAIGLLSVAELRRRSTALPAGPWLLFFAATTATTAGSMYYHLSPDNARVLWDRLPIAIACASLVTAVFAERVDARLGRIVFIPLVVFAAASVALWYWTELAGRGDLRAYVGVQFGSLIVLVAILSLYREPRSDTRYLVAGLIAYGAAKLFELTDVQVFALTHVISGHTLKHLAAAAGVAFVVAMLRRRTSYGWTVSRAVASSTAADGVCT